MGQGCCTPSKDTEKRLFSLEAAEKEKSSASASQSISSTDAEVACLSATLAALGDKSPEVLPPCRLQASTAV